MRFVASFVIFLFLKCSFCDTDLKFIEHPQYVVALPGDAVFFNCKTNDLNSDESIRWLHNGTRIGEHDVRFKTISSGDLTFSLSNEDYDYAAQLGEYQCLAGNHKYSLASLSAKLSVANLGDFGPARVKTIEVFENNDVALECDAPQSDPPPFIRYYKEGQVIDTQNEASMSLLNGDILMISNVTSSDVGKYTCSAANHITNEKKMSKSSTILRVKKQIKQAKSRITFRPREKYRIVMGENITIPCLASGNPKPMITWTRLGSNERLPSNLGILQIINAQDIDSGSYMCAIFNGSRRFLRRTTVEVLVPPIFIQRPELDQNKLIKEGDELSLHCQAMGTPEPSIEWYFNGVPVLKGLKNVFPNGTLHIPFIRKYDEGMYQCFIQNSIGQNFSNVMLNVFSNDTSYDEDDGWERSRNEYLDHLPLVPPSRPNVTQSARSSVLLTWKVEDEEFDSDEMMPIEFFKVQFREFRKSKERSDWRTLEEIINAQSRSFEVMGLKDGVRYKFRIVAVYANNDNLHGPVSKKFRLDERLDSDRAPKIAPTITQVLPLSESSLRVGWRMQSVSQATVEGYFIYLWKSSDKAEKARRKVTIIGHESHSYIFDDLDEGSQYEIQVEAFNFAGTSPPSRPFIQRTLKSSRNVARKLNSNLKDTEVIRNTAMNETTSMAASPSDVIDDDKITLYLVLAGIVVCVVLLLVICCSIVSCVQKRRARKSLSNGNAQIHEKYLDTSRHISMSQNNMNKYMSNSEHQIYASHSSSHHTAETSFSSPNRLSQILGQSSNDISNKSSVLQSQEMIVNRHPNNLVLADEYSDLNESMGEKISLGYEEYTDEPSRLSWKRRRKSEEYL